MKEKSIPPNNTITLKSLSNKLEVNNFGFNIRYFRKDVFQLTQKELSKSLGVSRATLALYESGDRQIPVTTLIKIADLFDLSLDVLCFRKKYLYKGDANNESI